MHILIPQHLSNLPVTQRRLKFTHISSNLRVRALFRQELLGRPLHRDGIISSIENLESQSALLDRQITDLAKVSGVNVTPCISLAGSGVLDEGGKVASVLVWLDHVSDAEGVDVIFEAAGEGACCFLAADFGECVSKSALAGSYVRDQGD